MVDVEHSGQDLTVDILLLAPEITDENSFCVVQHLTPLKFNISGKCFSGPVQHTNLALINCPNSRQVVSLDGLDGCFRSEVGFLCPKNVLKTVSSLQWLGFAWNPDLKLSFPRNHQPTSKCDHIHPLAHLGGRYFLSTTSGTLALSNGEQLNISPLAIYNFPCNVSFIGMETSLGTCPQRLMVSLPLFSTDTLSYVQWDLNSDDFPTLKLHHKSLTIPPPIKINHTVIDNFDELFQLYDSQLSGTLQRADSLIDQIEETTQFTYIEYITFIALGLSVVNFIVFCILCRCISRISVRHSIPASPPTLPTAVAESHQHKTCTHCSKHRRINRLKTISAEESRTTHKPGEKRSKDYPRQVIQGTELN